MRVVVIGAAGFIGSHLCLSLADGGNAVMAVDNLSHGTDICLRNHKGIEFCKGDASLIDFKNLIDDFQADAVCHLADASQASAAWDTLRFGSYVDGLINVLQASLGSKISKFVYASSADHLFGKENSEFPIRDRTKTSPADMYGVHKYNNERFIAHASSRAAKPKLRWTVVRLPYVYGPSMRHRCKGVRKGYCFISEAIRKPKAVLNIPGDGNQTRDFLWVADAVSALEIAIHDRGLVGTVNVGTQVEHKVRDVLGKIDELLNKNRRRAKPLKVEYAYKRKDKVLRSCVNAATMHDHRWQPKMPIAHGLQYLVDNGVEMSLDSQ